MLICVLLLSFGADVWEMIPVSLPSCRRPGKQIAAGCFPQLPVGMGNHQLKGQSLKQRSGTFSRRRTDKAMQLLSTMTLFFVSRAGCFSFVAL